MGNGNGDGWHRKTEDGWVALSPRTLVGVVVLSLSIGAGGGLGALWGTGNVRSDPAPTSNVEVRLALLESQTVDMRERLGRIEQKLDRVLYGRRGGDE